MGYNVIKISVGIIALVTGFFIYQYNFGSMYGGKKYQRKAFDSEARVLLVNYQKAQNEIFKKSGSYDANLHKQEPYVKSKSFTFGFANEDKKIEQYCKDCLISGSFFKLAAFGNFGDSLSFWVIDNLGHLTMIK